MHFCVQGHCPCSLYSFDSRVKLAAMKHKEINGVGGGTFYLHKGYLSEVHLGSTYMEESDSVAGYLL